MVIEKGTIKVAWISRAKKKLFSKMFDSLEEAKKFCKNKKIFLIFKLVKHKKMKEFEWKILPYGSSRYYFKILSKFADNF